MKHAPWFFTSGTATDCQLCGAFQNMKHASQRSPLHPGILTGQEEEDVAAGCNLDQHLVLTLQFGCNLDAIWINIQPNFRSHTATILLSAE